MRMPSMSAAFLIVIVMAGIIAIGGRSRTAGLRGAWPEPGVDGPRLRASRARSPHPAPRCPAASTCITSRAATPSPISALAPCCARLQAVGRQGRVGPRPLRAPGLERRAAGPRRASTGLRRCCATAIRSSTTAAPTPTADRRRRAWAPSRPGPPRPPTSPTTAASRVHRVERVTEYRHRPEERPARRRQAAGRGRARRPCAALLHDRMTESVLAERDAAAHLFAEQPAEPMEHVDVLAAAARRWRRPTASSAWPCPTTRSTTWSHVVHRARPQPDRRRTDDVRAGQQRALPPQDLQRRLHHRRRARRSADVRDDPQHRTQLAPQHTVVAYADNASVMEGGEVERWLPAGLHQRAAVPGAPARRCTC